MGPSARIATVAIASVGSSGRRGFPPGLRRDHGDVLDAERSADGDRRIDPQRLRPAAP
jgi:hypothetical protein